MLEAKTVAPLRQVVLFICTSFAPVRESFAKLGRIVTCMVERLVLELEFVGVELDCPPTTFKYDGGA